MRRLTQGGRDFNHMPRHKLGQPLRCPTKCARTFDHARLSCAVPSHGMLFVESRGLIMNHDVFVRRASAQWVFAAICMLSLAVSARSQDTPTTRLQRFHITQELTMLQCTKT